MNLWLKSLTAAALLLAAAPASAATILDVVGGGLTAANSNAICTSANLLSCATNAELRLNGVGTATGTITVDGANAIFDLTLVTASFLKEPSGVGGVEEVVFSSVSYQTTVPILLTGSGVSFTQNGVAFGTAVEGDFDSFGPAAVPIDVAAHFGPMAPVVGNPNCGLDASNTGQCSISFGQFLFPLTINGQSHYTLHTFNVTVTPAPEPSALLLLVPALGGVLALRRR